MHYYFVFIQPFLQILWWCLLAFAECGSILTSISGKNDESEALLFLFISSYKQPESATVALTLIAPLFHKILFHCVSPVPQFMLLVILVQLNFSLKGSFYVFLHICPTKPRGSVKSLFAVFCVNRGPCLSPLFYTAS